MNKGIRNSSRIYSPPGGLSNNDIRALVTVSMLWRVRNRRGLSLFVISIFTEFVWQKHRSHGEYPSLSV